MASSVSTYCGLLCEQCEYKAQFNCASCVSSGGNPFHGKCPVAECSIRKNHAHCGLCADFPCRLLTEYSCDPVHGDNPPGARIENLKKIKDA